MTTPGMFAETAQKADICDVSHRDRHNILLRYVILSNPSIEQRVDLGLPSRKQVSDFFD